MHKEEKFHAGRRLNRCELPDTVGADARRILRRAAYDFISLCALSNAHSPVSGLMYEKFIYGGRGSFDHARAA